MRIEQLRQALQTLGAQPCHEERVLRAWTAGHPLNHGTRRQRAEDFLPLKLRNALPALESELAGLARLRLAAVQPLHLLQQTAEAPPAQTAALRLLPLLGLLPALGLLFLLASRLGGSLFSGAVFTGGLVVLLGTLFLFARLLLAGCRLLAGRVGLTLRIVLRNLYRNRLAAASLFTALAAALLLVALIPQAERGLQAEVSRPEGMELPDLFLVDIQPEQQQPLADFFAGGGPRLSDPAPMVRGRIVRINGVPFADWRQQHVDSEERVFRRTEFNFSSRAQLDASETVVRGRPLSSEPWTGEGVFETLRAYGGHPFRHPFETIPSLLELMREPLEVSIGLASGRFLYVPQTDCFGDTVNVAFKLAEDIAGNGDILATDIVLAQLGKEVAPSDWRHMEISGLQLRFAQIH